MLDHGALMKLMALIRTTTLASLLACILVCGCGVVPAAISTPEEVQNALPQLVAGKSTRAELMLAYGTPAWSFENGRVLVWRLQDFGGGLQPWDSPPTVEQLAIGYKRKNPQQHRRLYNLVLVFNAQGTAERFALLETGWPQGY